MRYKPIWNTPFHLCENLSFFVLLHLIIFFLFGVESLTIDNQVFGYLLASKEAPCLTGCSGIVFLFYVDDVTLIFIFY